MVKLWALLFGYSMLRSFVTKGNVILDRADESELAPLQPLQPEVQQMCRKCLCRVDDDCTGPETSNCLTSGPMCCCCMPGLFPCSNMADLQQYPDELDGGLEALEEGLEDIGRLEK